MAKSKLVKMNDNIAEKVTAAYKKSKIPLSTAIPKLKMLLLTSI